MDFKLSFCACEEIDRKFSASNEQERSKCTRNCMSFSIIIFSYLNCLEFQKDGKKDAEAWNFTIFWLTILVI